MFSAMLLDSFYDDEETSIKIRYNTDGRLFNLQRLQAKTKVEEDSVRNFLFADDCTLNAATEAQMQLFHCLQKLRPHNQYQEDCGLASARTAEMYVEPTITTEEEILKAVDKFT
ncbi:hypothetical protein NDU88_001019 [Pleurodeles waltl]|uniref:Uncharacterized protein n=1 Tax=Pleurodeles waltl TaxID=8319 RepID=A0AAV7SY66_PLEWA|nr:hypothetical protein NDU88_001019 [Pleurodeles waltl]